MSEWMIDCETLAIDSRAAPWQLGLVNIGDPSEKYEWLLDPGEIRGGVLYDQFVAHRDTVKWTFDQHGTESVWATWHKAYEKDYPMEGTIKLENLVDWLTENTSCTDIYYAKGSDFDFPILSNYFKSGGFATPWHYRNKSCLRTLANEWKRVTPVANQQPLADIMKKNLHLHSAMADCENQIEQLWFLRNSVMKDPIG